MSRGFDLGVVSIGLELVVIIVMLEKSQANQILLFIVRSFIIAAWWCPLTIQTNPKGEGKDSTSKGMRSGIGGKVFR